MFSRNLLGSSSVWFHFGKRVLGSVGSFAIRMEIRQFISEAFPLDNACHGEMIGDDTKRTDEDAVKSEALPSRSSSWPNCTNDPSSKFLLPLPGFQTEIVPFAMLLSEPQSQRCAWMKLLDGSWAQGTQAETAATKRQLECGRHQKREAKKPQKKAEERIFSPFGGWRGSTSKTGNLGQFFSRNWAHCHTCPCWWYSDVSYAAPAPRMPCWILIVIPFSDAKWTGLGINTVSQSRCFPRFHSSVTSTPSSFRGFSSCFLSCHCGSAGEVWWKGWVSGNDMLNHLAITVSNTSANLSCASTSQKNGKHRVDARVLAMAMSTKRTKNGKQKSRSTPRTWGMYMCLRCLCFYLKSLLIYAYIPVQIYMLHVYMSRVQSRRNFLEFDPLVFWGISWTLGFRWVWSSKGYKVTQP